MIDSVTNWQTNEGPEMDVEKLFNEGCQLFDEGQYFEAHEVWEEIWHLESGARSAFMQGVIQVAAALHHATNGNYKGTHKLLASALDYLEKGRTDSDPVDMEKLIAHVLDFENAVQHNEASTESKPLPYFNLPVS